MGYYPISLDLENAPCLVVGGGRVGERKIKTLLSCGALVFLISLDLTSGLKEMVEQGRVVWLGPTYETGYLEKKRLVIGATDDQALNQRLSREARERGILCNIVDNPPLCDFILPSLLRRGNLSISVSTGGKSPALAKKIRQKLEQEFPPYYGPYVDLLGLIRSQILSRGLSQQENQSIFESLVNAPILSWLEKGEVDSLYAFLDGLVHPPLPRSSLSKALDRLFQVGA
jgi:precorrin-2 dehydrogenase / sirohydrochlorin ferrochelatase